MHDLDGGVGGVHALAAGTARAADFDAEVVGFEVEVDILGFGQHRDGRGGGVNAPLRFGRRHALHAMHAALEAQLPKDVLARDLEDRFAQSAELRRTRLEVFDLQARRFRVAVVHAVKIGGEDCRLAAAGAGADFDDRVAILVLVRRQQRDLEIALELGDAFLELREFPPSPSAPSRRRRRWRARDCLPAGGAPSRVRPRAPSIALSANARA